VPGQEQRRSPEGQRNEGGRCSIARVRYRQLVGGGHHAAALGSRPWGASAPLFAVLHLSLTSPRWARCWSSVGGSPRAWFVGLAGFPGTQAGPPGGHRAPVGLVVLGSSPVKFQRSSIWGCTAPYDVVALGATAPQESVGKVVQKLHLLQIEHRISVEQVAQTVMEEYL
jgi:hypothetical protein